MPGETKFSQSPAGSAIQDADFAPWVQSGINVKQPATAVSTYSFNSKTTTNLTEGINLYYTDARARTALSGIYGINYNSSIGQFSLLTLNQGQFIIGVNASNPIAGSLTSSDNSISIDASTNGEINLTANSSSNTSLQNAYDNGANAVIDLIANRPVSFENFSDSSAVNAITTQSTGSNTVANFRVLGWTFTPVADMDVTALQYDDVHFTQPGTRQCGIFIKSSQEQIANAYVAKTDPLDSTNTYRTHAIDSVHLTGGIQYVFATVVAANETDWLNSDAVPNASITISQYCIGNVSLFFIPLTFPTNFFSTANTVYVGSFQFGISSSQESVDINDGTTNVSCIFQVSSTARASAPFPSLTTTQRNSISSPFAGLNIYNTTTSTINYYDGTQWQSLATLANPFTWTDVLGTSQAMDPENGYVSDNAALVTLTLPTIASFGTEIRVLGKGAGGWRIAQNSGQSIQVGNVSSSAGVGGHIDSANQYDCVILTCITANTMWSAYGIQSTGLNIT